MEQQSQDARSGLSPHQLPRAALSLTQEQLRQLRANNERFSRGEWEGVRRRDFAILYPLRVLAQAVRQLIADRVLMRASSLAFITVTSLVPMLVVAGSLIMVFSGGLSAEGQGLIDVVQSYLMPVAGDRISGFIREAIERTTETGVGIVGGLALIVTAVMLVLEIEDSFNDIWKVTQRRPLATRVLLFYTLVTLGPLLLVLSVVQTARVGVAMDEFGLVGTLAHQLIPLLNSTVAFTLANKLLPNTKVRWHHAALAGLLVAFLFEVTKFGFTYYISNVMMARYDQIYGPLSLIPVFLLWIYISWVLILYGAELTYCAQHLQQLMRATRLERHFTKHKDSALIGSPLIGVELFAPIARAFIRGQDPLDIDQIAACSGHTQILTIKGLRRLERERLVVQVERDGLLVYIPARPLEQIPLIELVKVFSKETAPGDPIDAVVLLEERITRVHEMALGELTAHDLVKGCARHLARPLNEATAAAEDEAPLAAPTEGEAGQGEAPEGEAVTSSGSLELPVIMAAPLAELVVRDRDAEAEASRDASASAG